MINKIKLWKKFSILIFSVSFSLLSASDLGLGKEVKPFANQSIKNLRFDSDLRKIISEAKDDDLEILAKNNFDKTKLNETEEDELHAKEFCMKIENFAERRTYQLMRMIKQLNLISNDEYTDTFNIINKMIYEKSLKLYSFQIKKTFSNHDFSQAVTASMKLLKEKNIELENQIKIQHNFVSSSIRTSDGCEGIKNAYEENKNMIERLKKVEKNKSELIDQSYQDTLNTLAQYASRANTIENEARKKRFLTQKKFFPHEHAEIFLSHLELIKDNTRTITLLENTETPYDNNSANLLHNINFSIMKDQRLENLRKEYFCKVIETAKLILESYKKDSEVPQPFLCFNTLYKKILETSESQKKGNSGIIHNFAQKLSQQKLSPDCAADIYIEDWKLEKKFYSGITIDRDLMNEFYKEALFVIKIHGITKLKLDLLSSKLFIEPTFDYDSKNPAYLDIKGFFNPIYWTEKVQLNNFCNLKESTESATPTRKPFPVLLLGLNGAGKTAFMQNIGLCCLFSYSGICPGQKFDGSFLELEYLIDRPSKKRGISKGMYETKWIADIVKKSKDPKQKLCVCIDEILNATTLVQAHEQIQAYVSQFNTENIIFVASSHYREIVHSLREAFPNLSIYEMGINLNGSTTRPSRECLFISDDTKAKTDELLEKTISFSEDQKINLLKNTFLRQERDRVLLEELGK